MAYSHHTCNRKLFAACGNSTGLRPGAKRKRPWQRTKRAGAVDVSADDFCTVSSADIVRQYACSFGRGGGNVTGKCKVADLLCAE
jgi:hypothetical protein